MKEDDEEEEEMEGKRRRRGDAGEPGGGGGHDCQLPIGPFTFCVFPRQLLLQGYFRQEEVNNHIVEMIKDPTSCIT